MRIIACIVTMVIVMVSGMWFDLSRINAHAPLPSSLVINGQSWTVAPNAFSDDPMLSGETDCDKHYIWYQPTNDFDDLKNTLWHEVFHAGACAQGGWKYWNSESNSGQHSGIYHIADFLTQFQKDNPEFIEWEMSK